MNGDALPALRMHRLYDRLRSDGFDPWQIEKVRQAIRETLDNNTRRIGSVCDFDGCNMILTHEIEKLASYPKCPEHGARGGYFGGPFALAIEFPPITERSAS